MQHIITLKSLIRGIRAATVLASAFFVAACSDTAGPGAPEGNFPTTDGSFHQALRWERPILEHLTASVGTPSGEFELASGMALFDGSLDKSSSDAYAVSFWAVYGQDRYVKLELDGRPVVTFTVPALALRARSDGTPFTKGDSVLITMELDKSDLGVQMSPSGLQFSQERPAELSIWYDVADKDFNNDGVVDKYDEYIESNLLGMWYRQSGLDDWSRIESERVESERRISAPIHHFSGYVVSW